MKNIPFQLRDRIFCDSFVNNTEKNSFAYNNSECLRPVHKPQGKKKIKGPILQSHVKYFANMKEIWSGIQENFVLNIP